MKTIFQEKFNFVFSPSVLARMPMKHRFRKQSISLAFTVIKSNRFVCYRLSLYTEEANILKIIDRPCLYSQYKGNGLIHYRLFSYVYEAVSVYIYFLSLCSHCEGNGMIHYV